MSKTVRCCVALLVSAVLGATVTIAGEQDRDCEASVFVLQSLEKQPSVRSPDDRFSVLLGVHNEDDRKGWLHVTDGHSVITKFEMHDLSGGVFLKWSQDSRAFYLMWSDGGATGGYHVRAFRRVASSFTETPTTRLAEIEFDRQHPCPGGRDHNAFAVQWLKGSEEMLLALQVYPTSDCGKEMGAYRGFLVRANDGAILQRYSQAELQKLWPDGCPSRIYPTGFWGTAELEEAKRALGIRNPK